MSILNDPKLFKSFATIVRMLIQGELTGGSDGSVIGNIGDRLKVNSVNILAMVRASGLNVGETYDVIIGVPMGSDTLVQFELAGVCQFQIVVTETSTTFKLFKRDCVFDLLQRDGFRLLQRNGDGLLIRGIIPV